VGNEAPKIFTGIFTPGQAGPPPLSTYPKTESRMRWGDWVVPGRNPDLRVPKPELLPTTLADKYSLLVIQNT